MNYTTVPGKVFTEDSDMFDAFLGLHDFVYCFLTNSESFSGFILGLNYSFVVSQLHWISSSAAKMNVADKISY